MSMEFVDIHELNMVFEIVLANRKKDSWLAPKLGAGHLTCPTQQSLLPLSPSHKMADISPQHHR